MEAGGGGQGAEPELSLAPGEDAAPVEPPLAARLVARLAEAGPAAQAIVPGVYAWSVTVAPAAWSRGGSLPARAAAIFALASLGIGLAVPSRWRAEGSRATLWGFVLGAAVTWSLTPGALGAGKLDTTQGIAGMLGWGLFALAAAAPPLAGARAADHILAEPDLVARRKPSRGDAAFVVAGVAVALALQLSGWRAPTAERALLVRLSAIAAGLAVLGASAEIAIGRHQRATRLAPRRRLALAVATLVIGVSAMTAGLAVMGRP